MATWLYQLWPTRPDMLVTGLTEEETAAIQWHFEYLSDRTREGEVLLAGRTLNTDEESFGIVMYRAGAEEDARAIMEADPAVQAGVMRARLFPYRVALRARDEHWAGLD